MSLAVVLKAIRDYRLIFVLAWVASVVIALLVLLALSATPLDMIKQWMKLPFGKVVMRMLLGEQVEVISRTGFAAFTFVHPMIVVTAWSFLVYICTQVPAAEVDRGTADLLLSLPVSRWRIYVSYSLVHFTMAALLAVAPYLGVHIAEHHWEFEEAVNLSMIRLTIVNALFALWAVVGVGMGISACASRRGTAVAVLFAWLLGSFAINFLGAIWEPVERIFFLSILYYFRPLIVVRDGRLDHENLLILAGVALTGWIVGAIVFAQRDIRTT